MKKLLSRCMIGIVLSLTANNVLAERLQWKVEDGGNGHYYEGFDASVIWSEANKLAKALGGHLATITSDAENRWVFDNVGKLYYLLGGTDALEEGKWTWVTNEEWVYDRWNSGEPNNHRGNQNFLSYVNTPYVWDDLNGSSKAKGFIVEYENGGLLTQSTPQTCQPATLSDDFKLHIPLLHYSPLANDDTIIVYFSIKKDTIRLPQFILQKYGFTNWLSLEETERGILWRNMDDNKLSYEETYKAIAEEQEDWSDFDQTLLDGLESI